MTKRRNLKKLKNSRTSRKIQKNQKIICSSQNDRKRILFQVWRFCLEAGKQLGEIPIRDQGPT